MAEYLLITGEKYNKNVRIILTVLLAAVFIGVMAVSGWSLQILPTPKEAVKEVSVNQITADALYQSSYTMPLMVTVLRSDGSYSFAKIENGVVMGSRLFGLTQLSYQNGDSGLVEEKSGAIDVFVSKNGTKETVKLVERAVTGITLADGQVLPVKVISGKIVRGKLMGDFEMASLTDNSAILGKFDTRGNLVQVEVRPSVKEPDRAASMVGKELLKLAIEMEAGKTGSVLAATTDEPAETAGTTVIGEAVGASLFRVTRNTEEGSLEVVSAAPAAVTTLITPSFSGDVTINSVTGLTAIGSGAVTGVKIANGAISETQLANDAVVESRIKDSAVTSNKISDGTISDTDISGSAAITDGKLATISTAGKVSGSAVQLAASGGLTNNGGLSLLTSCASGEVLQWNGSAWACAAVSGSGGVSSLNSLTGALTVAGGGINSVSVLGSTITVTGTIPSLDPTYFTTANISQWTNNAGYITDGNTNWDNSYGFITDGNTNWDNSYGFITASSSDILTNKTIAAGSNTITGLTNSNLSGTAGITDANLAQLTTANKVAGSAVQLNANGGITNNSGLSLLTTCSSGEILKWGGSAWACAADNAGAGALTVRESDGSPSINPTSTLEFGPSATSSAEFVVTDQTGGVVRVRLGDKVVLTDASQVLTNKTIDASLNTISGITASNMTAGDFSSVINTGTYSINISGNAATASSAFNATYLNGLNFSNPGAITNATGFNGLAITANTGVITTGTWNGSLVGLTYGGTNKNMTAVNGGIVWTDADSMEVSAAGTTGQILSSNGSSAPSWIDATTLNFWQRNSGSLSPQQITNALILGATATSSAIVNLPGTTNNDAFVNLGTGKLGIGTTTPSWQLSQVGNNAGNIASIFNANTTNSTTMSALRIAIGTTSTTTNARFVQFYAGATTDSDGTGVGRIKLNNNAVQYQSGGADVAEYMTVPSSEGASAGDIIAASTGGNVKASSSNNFMIGVVSDTAAFVGNATETAETDPNKRIVGVTGFVSTKVTGDIAIGDPITAGSTAGVGVKATKAGYIIGKAAAAHSGSGTDRVLVSVLPGWYDPQALATTTAGSFTISGNDILDSNGDVVTRIGAFEGIYTRDATISGTVNLPNGVITNSNLVNSSLTVSAGTGLSGGGSVSLGGTTTLSLPNVGTSGTYGGAASIPVLTTDAQGRITNVTPTAISGLTTANFGSANISQWTNNSGYITDGNTNWDNSYGFITDGNTGWDNIYDLITSTGSAVLTNKTIAAGSNTITGLTNSNLSGTAGITDANLAQLTTANKVAGSAVQLNANGGITNNSGLSLLTTCSSGEILKWGGSAWACATDLSGGSPAFSGISSGTNTTAAMVVGTGASLNYSGSGTINASSLSGATFANPGSIGSGTPGTGVFTTLTGNSSITSTGLLTASNGLTMTTGALSLTSTSGSINSTGLTGLTYSLSSGTAAITAPTLNLNTSATGNTAIGNSTGTFALTSSGGLNVSTGGALTGVASIDTITVNSTNITFAGAGTLGTSTGNLTLQPAGSGTTANVQIGAGSGSSTPDLLVLDNKNTAGDPTGTAGAMYYNSNTGKFRCYENGTWTNCIGSAASSFTDSTLAGVSPISFTVATEAWDDATRPNITVTRPNTKVLVNVVIRGVSDDANDQNPVFIVRRATGANPTCSGAGGTDVDSEFAGGFLTANTQDWGASGSFVDSPTSSAGDNLRYTICTTVNGLGDATLNTVTVSLVGLGADLAENYYTTDSTISEGDVVSIDSSLPAGVKKSMKRYDNEVLGVISTTPGQVLDDAIGMKFGRAVPVALAGRVQMKVSRENGDINAGDYLTASSLPGVAMKATKAGVVIGQALEDYNHSENIGLVMAFVKTQYFTGEKTYMFEDENIASEMILERLNNDTSLVTSNIDLSEINTDRVLAGLEIITPKVLTQNLLVNGDATVSGILYADTIKANRIEGVDILTRKLSLLTEQVAGIATDSAQPEETVKQAETNIFEVIGQRIAEVFKNTVEFLGKVIFRGEVNFAGRPTFNKDTAGFAIVKAGGSEVEVIFEKEYADEPIVTATAQIVGGANVADIPTYAVADVNTKSFKIRLSRTTGMDIRFAWMALAVADKASFQSANGEVNVNVTPPVPDVTPTTEIIPTPTMEVTPNSAETATSAATMEVTPSPTQMIEEVTPTVELTPTPAATEASVL